MKRLFASLFVLSAYVALLAVSVHSLPARADTVTCNDGSVHSSPTVDYACAGPGENGVKSVAPYVAPGAPAPTVCPAGFERAGSTIPAGQPSSWCNELKQPGEVCSADRDPSKAGKTIPAGKDGNWCNVPGDDPYATQSASNSFNCATDIATKGLDIKCNAAGGPIYGLINFTINWLIGILGGLAVLAIIVAGIQYTVSQGNPDALKKAKSRITNAVVGLILLSLMFVILKFIGIGQ